MIDLTIYLASVGILSSFIIAFVIHNLKTNKKDYESQKKITELQTENTELKEYKIKYLQLQDDIHQKEAKKAQKENIKKDTQNTPPKRPGSNWVNNWR